MVDNNFNIALLASFVTHIILFIAFNFGMPYSFETYPVDKDVITFDIVSVDDIANVSNEDINNTQEEEVKKAQNIKTSEIKVNKEGPKEKIEELADIIEQPAEPIIEKPIEPKLEEKKAPEPIKKEKIDDLKAQKSKENIVKISEQPKKKSKELIEKNKEEKNKTTKKKEKKETKKAPPPEKKQIKKPKKPVNKKKPKVKNDADIMDSILKNLEDESIGETEKSRVRSNKPKYTGKKFSRSDEFNKNIPISITEKMLIKRQIEKHWRLPVGTEGLNKVRILLNIKMAKDGTVKNILVKNIKCPMGASRTCKMTEDSVVSATKKASPLKNLDPKRYDVWKDLDLDFDPSMVK